MVDISAISGLISSIKASTEISKALLNLRDENLIREKVGALNIQLFDAYGSALDARKAQAELLDQVDALKETILKFEKWDAEKERYQLAEVAPGAFAYALKAGAEHGEPPHHICPACYEQRRKSILQGDLSKSIRGTSGVLKCLACGATIRVSFRPAPRTRGVDTR